MQKAGSGGSGGDWRAHAAPASAAFRGISDQGIGIFQMAHRGIPRIWGNAAGPPECALPDAPSLLHRHPRLAIAIAIDIADAAGTCMCNGERQRSKGGRCRARGASKRAQPLKNPSEFECGRHPAQQPGLCSCVLIMM